jgi:hypothetical protein
MTDKEKADCLIELHKAQLQHLMQTRDIEFKVNVALWALIAGSGSFLYGKLHLNGWCHWVFYSACALAIYLGHIFLWMVPIQQSTDTDNHYVNQYRSRVEALAGSTFPESPKCKLPTKWRRSGWRWVVAETGITLILLVAVGLLLSSR